jgi:hypothetical protein
LLTFHRGARRAAISGILRLAPIWQLRLIAFEMGMDSVYRRLADSEFQEILADPEKAAEFMNPSFPGFDVEAMMKMESTKNPELLEAKQQELMAAFEKRQEDPTRVDLEKEWHALHFLLTGESALDGEHRPDNPLHNLVMGGHETDIEATYGPLRYFTSEDVNIIADALKLISVDDLRSRFSAEAFNEEEIYPNPRPGGWTMEEIEGLLMIYPKLVQFFNDACASGQIVVTYLE